MSLVGSIVASGACGDPASQSGKFEALGKVSEGESVGPELLLQGRTVYPGLNTGGAGDIVDLQHPVEPGQIN